MTKDETKQNTNKENNGKVIKKNLSTTPYKGTTDKYPEEMFYYNYLSKVWRKVAENFGYEEYDTPLIEEALLYKIKSGEDLGTNQLYSFTDKGGRKIAIRPEMTPSLARIVAARRKELRLPLRWFNIGKYYRYEKPQRGRSREFMQLNIDLIGVEGMEADLEIIQFVIEVMNTLQAPKETYELKINNRYLLEYVLEKILQIKKESQKKSVIKAIDNYTKIKNTDFPKYLEEIELNNKQIDNLLNFLTWEIKDLEAIKNDSRGAKELLDLFEKISSLEIENVKFSPYIVRGLDYYTGTVMEMFDVGSDKNPRALFGGGRYDNLLEIFGEEKIPAVGLGWGDVTTLDYLKTYSLLPEYKGQAEIFVTLMDESLFDVTSKTAQYLRENNIQTEMQLTPIRLNKQLDYANKRGVPWVIILGDEELKDDTVLLKNMKTSEQKKLPLQEVLSELQ